MTNNETLADIIAEMRKRAARREISPEVYGLADRIEAAAERDIGNAAALREALEEQLRYWDTHVRDRSEEEMRVRTAAALSAPARKCDRYATWKDAWDAFAVAYFGPTDPGEMEYSFGVWLFAKAKEAEQ